MLTNKSNNIFFEYVLSSTPGKRTVIVLVGVPTQPKYYNIFDWFTKEGFDVFFLDMKERGSLMVCSCLQVRPLELIILLNQYTKV